MKFSNFKYLVKQGFSNFKENRTMSVASIGVVLSCLIIVGVCGLLAININSFAKPLWLSDSVKKSDDKHYILRIEIETARCNTEYFAVEFEFAEIERK